MDSDDSSERYTSLANMVLSGIIAALVLFVISFVTYLAFAHGFTFFAWHPPFMLIGFLLFMTHAVLAFSGDNFLTRRVPRANRVKLHWVLQACAATSISIAFACIYTYKVRKNSEHFTTSHGNLGSWTLLLCIGTVGGGILASNAASLRQIVKPVIIKIVHSSFGLISYSMAILTIFLGLNHPWTHERLSNAWINTLIAIVAVIWLCAVSRPVITVCGRIGGLARSS